MISVTNLTKQYADKIVLDNVSFDIAKGEVVGLLGPNGAGKTTLMNILTGYISATSGQVLINGCDVLEDPISAKAQLAYLPEHPPLYFDMTVEEFLLFSFELHKLTGDPEKRIDEVCEIVDITNMRQRLIKNLSKGYKQRTAFARVLLCDAEFLIFDEPTEGLDPTQIVEFRKILFDLKKNHTILISSHILSEIAEVCDRVIIINKGSVVADQKIEGSSEIGENNIYVRIDGPQQVITGLVESIQSVGSCSFMGTTEQGCSDFLIRPLQNMDVRREIFASMSANGYPIIMMHPYHTSLEELFLHSTGYNNNESNIS